MQHIYLTDSVIHYPKTDCIYHLKCPTGEIKVTFAGSSCSEVAYFDVSVGLCGLKNGIQGTVVFDHMVLISNETLPWEPSIIPKLPIFFYYLPENKLSKLTAFHFDFDHYELNKIIGSPLSSQPEFDNNNLRLQCKNQVPKLNVSVGKYPILSVPNKPNIHFLTDLYQKFIKFNKDSKLINQYKLSEGRCHLRAHFLNELLNLMGLDSVKVFKKWKQSDWINFDPSKNWEFHCAVMITDSDNNQWILDPWVGLNHRMLTLKEWLSRKDEPVPLELLITNRGTVNPLCEGRAVFGSRFNQLHHFEFNTFQAVAADAIPNPPVFDLPDVEELELRRKHNKNRFFLTNESNEKKPSEPIEALKHIY